MEMEIFKILAAGGDLAGVAFLLFAWRMDKRVTKLEWQREQCCDLG